jgi:hypothetical protein
VGGRIGGAYTHICTPCGVICNRRRSVQLRISPRVSLRRLARSTSILPSLCVYMYVCMYVSMYVCMYVCVCICVYVCAYVCLCVCVCAYVCMSPDVHTRERGGRRPTVRLCKGYGRGSMCTILRTAISAYQHISVCPQLIQVQAHAMPYAICHMPLHLRVDYIRGALVVQRAHDLHQRVFQQSRLRRPPLQPIHPHPRQSIERV